MKKKKKTGFFKNVKNELSKVKWPTTKEVFKNTISTIIFCVFFALFFYLVDVGFSAIVRLFN